VDVSSSSGLPPPVPLAAAALQGDETADAFRTIADDEEEDADEFYDAEEGMSGGACARVLSAAYAWLVDDAAFSHICAPPFCLPACR
jgi:hypothetical protein